MQRIFKTLRTPGSTIYVYEFPFKGYLLTSGRVTEEGKIGFNVAIRIIPFSVTVSYTLTPLK